MSYHDDITDRYLEPDITLRAIDELSPAARVRLLLELTESRPDLADLPLRVAVMRIRRGEVEL